MQTKKNRGFCFTLNVRVEGLDEITQVLRDILQQLLPQPKPQFRGGFFVITVQDNHADVPYTITPPDVTDAEGNPIPDAHLTYLIESTDPSVVEITPTDPADPAGGGNVHFGNPGVASVNVRVWGTSDTTVDPLGSFGSQFTVSVGDPAGIQGGKIQFGDLVDNP